MDEDAAPRRCRAKHVAAGIFLIAFAARIFALAGLVEAPYFLPADGDTAFYHQWALRILGGQWSDGRAFYGLPGYAWLLAGIYRVAGVQPFVVGAVQALIDSATCLVVFRLAWITVRSDRALIASLAALGWAFFLPAQAFSIVLMPSAWLVFVYWSCLAWIVSARPGGLWRPWLGIGVVIGLAATVVATILFLIPAALFAILRNEWGRPRRSLAVRVTIGGACLIGGVLAGLGPAWMHNTFVARDPVLLSAHTGINFYVGNNAEATGYPKMPEGMRAGQAEMMRDSIAFAEAAAGRPLRRSEVSAWWSSRAKEFIREHPGAWLRLMAVKLRNFWSSHPYDDLGLLAKAHSDGILLPGLGFGPVAALGLAGCVFVVRRFPGAGWVAAGVGLHMLAILPVFVTERYRLAAVPGLAILAAGGLVTFWSALGERRFRQAATYASVGALAAVFVFWPQRDPALLALDEYSVGINAIDRDRLADAELHLSRAHALVPGNAQVQFALGNVALARSDLARAEEWYQQALALDPRHTGALNNLGYLALQEKDWETARRFLAASLESEPLDPETNYMFAKASLELDDLPLARRSIGIALAARPGQKELLELREAIEDRAASRERGR